MTAALALGAGAVVLPLSPAVAEPPQRLEEQVTDPSGHLSPAEVREVVRALEELEDGHGIELHVVLVDDFDGMDGVAWTEATFDRTGLGADDALLAVAVEARRYGLVDEADVDPERARQIAVDEVEPQLREQDWAGAAVAAARGYAVAEPVGGRSAVTAMLGTLGAMAAVTVGGVGTWSWRRRRARQRTLLADREATILRIGPLRERLAALAEDVRYVPAELAEEDAGWAGEQHRQGVGLLDEAVTALGQVPSRAGFWPPGEDTTLGRRHSHDRAVRALDRLDQHLTATTEELRQARDLVSDPDRLSGPAEELAAQQERRRRVPVTGPRTEPAAPVFVRRRVAELLGEADSALGAAEGALGAAREHVRHRRGRAALAAVASAQEQVRLAASALDRAADPQTELDRLLAELRDDGRALHRRITEGDQELGQHTRYAWEPASVVGAGWSTLSPDVLIGALRTAREVADLPPGDDPQARLNQVRSAGAELDAALAPYRKARERIQEHRRQRELARARAWEEAEDDSGWSGGWSTSRSTSWSYRSGSSSRSSRSRTSSNRSSRSSRSSSSRSRSSSSGSRSSSRNRSGGRF